MAIFVRISLRNSFLYDYCISYFICIKMTFQIVSIIVRQGRYYSIVSLSYYYDNSVKI